MPIAPVTNPLGPVSDLINAQKPAAAGSGPGFRAVLEAAVDRVETSRSSAQALANSFINGGNEELHSVALAAQRAELEFDLLLQIRNKVVSAYQEIMRMQV